MIRCAVSRRSSSAKLLTAIGRSQISTAKPRAFNNLEREHGISDPSYTPQPIEPSTEKDDVRTTTREVRDGLQQPPSTTKPLKRRDLPISPYMDPKTISAKEKHHAPKPRPNKNPTAFQKLIAKNPYALALASPVRTCRVTSITLPRYFLQDFNLMVHPETKEPWWVPRSLARKHSHLPLADEHPDSEKHISTAEGANDNSKLSEEFDINDLETDTITLDEPESTIASLPEKLQLHSPSIGPHSYVLARQPLLEQFAQGSRRYRSPHMQILETSFPARLRERGHLHNIFRTAKIRPDIDTFALELMRRRLVEALEHLLKLGVYIRPSDSWKDATLPSRQTGVILWTGSIQGEPNQFDVEREPPEFATIDIGTSRKRKVPVHNLETLLGEDHLRKLKEISNLFGKKLLIVKHKNMTVDIQMKLWKLQGFLAEYRLLDTDLSKTGNRLVFGKDEGSHQETA